MGVPEPSSASHHALRLARLGLAAAMVSRLVGRLVGIVLIVALAREAAPSTVAVYGYLLGTATLVLTLTDLGVAAVAGREVAARRLPAAGALWAALPIQLASVLTASALALTFILFWGPQTPPMALVLTVLFIVIGGMNNLWADLLRGSGRVVVEGILQFGSSVVLVLVGVLVVHLGGGVIALTAVVALKEAAILVVGWSVLRPRRDAEVRSRALLAQGVWMALQGTAIVLLWRQGALVIGALGSIGTLATYVIATRFLDAGVTVAHTTGVGLGPGMAALAGDTAAFRRAGRKYLGLATLLGIVIAVVGYLAAGPITTVPFGAKWEVAVPAVRVIAVSGLPILVCYVSLTLLNARSQVRWMTYSTMAGALVSVATSATLALARPTALAGIVGTMVGATVLAVMLLWGLRDMFQAVR